MKYLDEVVAELRLGERMNEPERFLIRQIKSGRVKARKVGRNWMMTDSDIADMLEVFAAPSRPRVASVGLSAGSARRRAS